MTEFEIPFEESLSDTWDNEDRGIAEVPLPDAPLRYVGFAIFTLAAVVFGQIFFLNVIKKGFYVPRANANLGYSENVPAPRGLIVDRNGEVIAENKGVFSAFLDVKEFLKNTDSQAPTLAAITQILSMPAADVMTLVHDRDLERSADPILLLNDISHAQLVALQDSKLSTLEVEDAFERSYPDGPAFSSLLGYVGLATKDDLKAQPDLNGKDMVGKAGVEKFYDDALRGVSGVHVTLHNAKGATLGEEEERLPKAGDALHLTIDGEFQKYFYDRFEQGLKSLNRTAGAAIAIDPRNGEVLALMSFPSFDPNLFAASGNQKERQALLLDPDRPLFDRPVGGVYNPGSTIKPLVGVAALTEGVISPTKTIFSPGYLDVPNRYNPDNPTRFLDWRYQGDVDLAGALAQSSNVYFYTVGGGAGSIKGLGLEKLHSWWEKFKLGDKTGIDLPGEAQGFLPTAEWKETETGKPWLLGDTYHVSIGQGDLSITPMELMRYITAIANGGTLYVPHVKQVSSTDALPGTDTALQQYLPAIKEVQDGMRTTVTSALGTAHIMNDLPFEVSGKTGSAQVKNNAEENAFFVGYTPSTNPEIAIMVLVENAKEGSLNAVPIAKDVLNWYYQHRIAK
jgi:penicillin-binding protein 2